MNLSYALGDDADLRRRLMIKIGAPVTALESVTASANNHTSESPESDALDRITSAVYQAAQDSGAARASVKGETGAF